MVPVVVIGAGPAGLATAACLLRHGVRPLVLDRGEYVGQSWAERYDRLHLHTPRIQSHLPGLRLPRSYGRWVARDDFVRYLQRYAAHHGIEVRFGVEVDAVRPAPGGHRVTGAGVDVTARHVVLATGFNRVPVVPEWPGAGSFTGSLVHSSAYRDATPYRGRDVLVAGIGNSGAEIAADLAESGAGRVRIAVRTPPHVVTRQVGPLPTTLIGIAQAYLPAWLVDPGSARLARAVVGDLSAYDCPRRRRASPRACVASAACPSSTSGWSTNCVPGASRSWRRSPRSTARRSSSSMARACAPTPSSRPRATSTGWPPSWTPGRPPRWGAAPSIGAARRACSPWGC